MADRERNVISGVITSVTRRKNSNNKEFGEVVIGEEKVSAWDQKLIALAETCVFVEGTERITVDVNVSRNAGSRWWNIDAITPRVDGVPQIDLTQMPLVTESAQTPRATEPQGKSYRDVMDAFNLRKEAMTLAISAMSQCNDTAQLAVPSSVIQYAKKIAQFLSQGDEKEG